MITDHQHLLWARIDAFNAACPPGTAVLLTSEDGHATRTETIGEAYEEGCHAFIRVRHAAAPVPLHLLKTLP